MFLNRYSLRNFRRLEDVEIKLEEKDTVFVGANNSGKTSATAAFRLFVSQQGDIKIYDFPSPLISELNCFGEVDFQPDIDYEKELPAIELDLWFTVTSSIYGRVAHLLPSITSEYAEVGVRIRFAINQPGELHSAYCSMYPKPSQDQESVVRKSLSHFLSQGENLKRYFGFQYYMLEIVNPPTESGDIILHPMEKDEGRAAINSLLHVDYVEAQRNINDNDSARSNRLSTVFASYYRCNLEKQECDNESVRVIDKSNSNLTDHYATQFLPLIRVIKSLGFPALNDRELRIVSNLNPEQALSGNTAVTDLTNLPKVNKFTYDESGRRDYSNGYLGHEDIIDLVSIMILKLPILQRIIGQTFPFIFIDEVQDTFGNVIEALNSVAHAEGSPIIGYFGDPMQQIYFDNRAGEFKGPDGSVVITKLENYRCSKEVIKLLNVIRPELQQIPGNKNAQGSVEIRLIQSEKGAGNRNTYSEDQLSRALTRFDIAKAHIGWSDTKDVKQLFLTWQMISYRLGFSNLNMLFTGTYSSETSQDAFRKGNHFLLQPFVDVLVPLVEANTINDYVTMTQVMRKYSPILDSKGENEFTTIKEVITKAQSAVNALVEIWSLAPIRDILSIARSYKLITISDHLAKQLDRLARDEIYDESKHSKEKEDWLTDNFLKLHSNELSPYRNFVLESTPYGTQHGVKGDEFEKVLVIFDDTEANWNIFNFSRLLTPVTAKADPTEGQKKRSLNLAYVCFSRAMKDLRIILFTNDPINAKDELVKKGLFTIDQVTTQLI